MQYLEWIFNLLLGWYNSVFYTNVVPTVNAGTALRTAGTNLYYYRLTAIDSDAVIASANGLDNQAVSGLAGKTILEGNSLDFPLLSYTLTSGTMVEYKREIKITDIRS